LNAPDEKSLFCLYFYDGNLDHLTVQLFWLFDLYAGILMEIDMDRYLVESNHTEKDCQHVVEQFIIHGHIHNFDWGCKAGVHTGWAIVEAENDAQALMTVPSRLRSNARAILLCKFTPESIETQHK
jgi:hypothetical protein